MIRSMTGYGQAAVELPHMRLTVELRSVNNRFTDLRLNLPKDLARCEADIRRRVLSHVRRGRVELTLRTERTDGGEAPPALNRALLQAVLQARTVLHDEYALSGELDPATVVSLSGMFRPEPTEAAWDAPELEALTQAVDRALIALDEDRLREGRALQQDLLRRIEHLQTLTAQAREQAGRQPGRIRDRLTERLQALAGEVELDPARLAQEAVFLAERSDVTEELVRLDGHLEQTRALLKQPEERRVGKRLDFLLQEIHRETNTLGSKSADLELTRTVLALKVEAEKVREQVQNVE